MQNHHFIKEINETRVSAIFIRSRKCLEKREKTRNRVLLPLPGQATITAVEFLEFFGYRVYTYGLFYKFKLKH